VKDLAQDVAEDLSGAARDGGVKVFIVKVFILPIVTCKRRNARHACPQVTREGRAREG